MLLAKQFFGAAEMGHIMLKAHNGLLLAPLNSLARHNRLINHAKRAVIDAGDFLQIILGLLLKLRHGNRRHARLDLLRRRQGAALRVKFQLEARGAAKAFQIGFALGVQ